MFIGAFWVEHYTWILTKLEHPIMCTPIAMSIYFRDKTNKT